MRLLVFIGVMVISAIGMALMSYVTGASTGVIGLRVIAVLVAMQVAYFILLLIMAALPSQKSKMDQPEKHEPPAVEPIVETQKN